MSLITNITSESQLSTLLSAKKDRLVVVDFWASWCGPCRAIAPKYEQWSSTYRDATFCKVDVDACQDIAKAHSVTAMPTFIFFKNGSKVDQVRGANASAIEAALRKHTSGKGAGGGAFPGAGHSLSGADSTRSAVSSSSSESAPISLKVVVLLGILFFLWYRFAPEADDLKDRLPVDLDNLY